jgi:hypothetical protein
VSKDIGPILEGWSHDPGHITVRKVRGLDGKVKIQLRVDLGLLQMESAGRPDGQRPHDCESLLEYHEKRLRQHRHAQGSEEGFFLDAAQCEAIRAEAIQYYYRYLAEFVLEDYDAVIRDTGRNLRVMDLCGQYAEEESDQQAMEQYRPYILMMNTRARAHLALRNHRPKAARRAVQEGLGRISDFFAGMGRTDLAAESGEVDALKSMLKQIEAEIPIDPLQELKRRLAKAVEEERYEEAARLRDAIAAVRRGDLQ